MEKIVILLPVYNDWNCAVQLIKEIKSIAATLQGNSLNFVLVNDCSSDERFDKHELTNTNIEIIDLIRNMGHQKAIAIGLSYIVKEKDFDFVIVMDADGEDKPIDILNLLATAKDSDAVVFARRTKRNEGFLFRKFYWFYKIAFKSLTGRVINFGNFSLLPYKYAERVVYLTEIWNSFPGGILKSRFPVKTISAERGKRYSGKSKMNFTSLIMHGFGAISIYIDVVTVRLIILSLIFIGISILVSLFIFLFPSKFPQQAVNFSLAIMVILVQVFSLGFFSAFSFISQKTSTQIIPILEYKKFIFKIRGYDENGTSA